MPRTTAASVRFSGLDDFLKGIGALDDEVKKAEDLYVRRAAKTIVKRAKENARRVGRQQVKAAKGLKITGPGEVTYGGLEWSMGAEFGSYVFRQFPEWRGNKGDAGYFFWPAVRQFRDSDMVSLWARQVWRTVQKQLAE